VKILSIESPSEDFEIRISRVGRRIIICTPRPGVASAVERRIIKVYQGEAKEPQIGFAVDDD
jgi:hypothetical protein